MLLDGHSAASICERLVLSGPNLLYRWKQKLGGEKGIPASTLDARVDADEAEQLGRRVFEAGEVSWLRRAQPATWRCDSIKAAAEIRVSARRVHVRLSDSWP